MIQDLCDTLIDGNLVLPIIGAEDAEDGNVLTQENGRILTQDGGYVLTQD